MSETHTSKVTKLLHKVFGEPTDFKVKAVYVYGQSVEFTLEGSLNFKDGMLNTLLKLRDTLGGTDVDIPSHYHVGGCETCDFGSYDVYNFVVKGTDKNKLLC